MKSLLRLLAALALAIWVAVPVVGSDGGDNAGGTGIWILPRATCLASGMEVTPPRAAKVLTTFNHDVVMQVSSECGAVVATFVDDLSGQPVSLATFSGQVRIPASLLQAMAGSSCPKAPISPIPDLAMGR